MIFYWFYGWGGGRGASAFLLIKIKNSKSPHSRSEWGGRGGRVDRFSLFFSIGLHEKDHPFLQQIKNFLSVESKIVKQGPHSIQLIVRSLKDLKIIMDHLEKFSMIT